MTHPHLITTYPASGRWLIVSPAGKGHIVGAIRRANGHLHLTCHDEDTGAQSVIKIRTYTDPQLLWGETLQEGVILLSGQYYFVIVRVPSGGGSAVVEVHQPDGSSGNPDA